MFNHILLPTDGSVLSESAVRAGIRLAKSLNARVTGLCVAPAARELFFDSEFPGVKTDRATAAFTAWADANLSLIASVAREAGVPCEVTRSTGDQIYDAIISAAEKSRCDLIVMASHGRKGAAAFLLGSETQKVLTHTKIPVLVYR